MSDSQCSKGSSGSQSATAPHAGSPPSCLVSPSYPLIHSLQRTYHPRWQPSLPKPLGGKGRCCILAPSPVGPTHAGSFALPSLSPLLPTDGLQFPCRAQDACLRGPVQLCLLPSNPFLAWRPWAPGPSPAASVWSARLRESVLPWVCLLRSLPQLRS